jgi:hypothetical protein
MISIPHNITKLKGMGNLFTKWGWANQPYLQLRAKLHELRRTQLNLIESKSFQGEQTATLLGSLRCRQRTTGTVKS